MWLRHRARSIEQQGASLSPRGPLPLREAWCESTLRESSVDRQQHRVELGRREVGLTAGASLSWIPGPYRSPGATWIFSPDFESRKTGQRGIMRKNRLFCNECLHIPILDSWCSEDREKKKITMKKNWKTLLKFYMFYKQLLIFTHVKFQAIWL